MEELPDLSSMLSAVGNNALDKSFKIGVRNAQMEYAALPILEIVVGCLHLRIDELK